jgi:multicomponent Na+:H+ antiporter subunit G
MIREVITGAMLVIGTAFMLIAGLGIVRMPDLFLRMSMTTKASTFGTGFLLLACMTFFDDTMSLTNAAAIILFLLLTAPVSAHMIGRAGYLDKDVHLWEGTVVDQLKGQYDVRRTQHTLDSLEVEQEAGAD